MRNITASEIIGLPVFAIREGKYMNVVSDVIYHPAQNKIEALLIAATGWFTEPYIVYYRDIRKVGEDAVLIETEELLKKVSEVEGDVSTSNREDTYLSGVKIITVDGVNLGKVSDIFFNPATGKVEEFEVAPADPKQYHLTERIEIQDIVSVGRDVAIVKAPKPKPYDAATSPEYPFP